MSKLSKLELAHKHIGRAATLMREHLAAIAAEGSLDDEIDLETALQMDAYNRILGVLDTLNPERNAWPKKEGKCQVVDINQYKADKLNAVCKGG